MQFFVKDCVCGCRMVVHAFRAERKGNEKVVYAHCENPKCRENWKEVNYTGEVVKPTVRLEYDKKREKVSRLMKAPRVAVLPISQVFMRRQGKNAHMGA